MAYNATIDRRPIGCLIDLRGEADSVADLVRPIPLPMAPNTWLRAEDVTAIRIGPDHWMLRAAPTAEAPLMERLGGGTDAVSVVAVSDAYACFEISGPDASDIIAQASPLDVHARAFPENGATFTEFFGQKALLMRAGANFECFVDMSYADYIADFLSRCNAPRA